MVMVVMVMMGVYAIIIISSLCTVGICRHARAQWTDPTRERK